MTTEFYSNGKLLISGEYAILDGAFGLAIPTRFGQYLRVTSNESNQISWESLDEKGSIWFKGTYDIETFKEYSTSDKNTSDALQKILSETRRMNPLFLTASKGYTIETELTFAKDWGLGSSSTLINNIANLAKVNAQELLARTFGGSGYDIACAQYNQPILYQTLNGITSVKEVEVKFPFTNQLYFIYLNKKKNSREAITAYRKRAIDKDSLTKEITLITLKMIAATSIEEFEALVNQHEKILSKALGVATIKSELFEDYPKAIKSLGGWGGDFILAIGDKNTPAYFKNKGYHTILSYQQMIV